VAEEIAMSQTCANHSDFYTFFTPFFGGAAGLQARFVMTAASVCDDDSLFVLTST
jgi:hypothetical protein